MFLKRRETMFARVMFFRTFITWILINIFSTTNAITYSDRDNYDAYGTLVASTDHFVVLAQNDLYRYAVSMAPFGMQYFCAYDYAKSPPMLASNNFVINVATGRRQNSSQLFFVYFQTNSTIGGTQKLGIFSFSRETIQGSNGTTCSRRLGLNQGEREIKAWNDGASEMSLLKVDLYAKYAYGFLSKNIFIYDIENSSVKFLQWNDVLPSTTLQPMAVDIGQTHDGISIAILAGYYQIDMGKSLPAVYLLRLNPPNNMSLITSYIIQSNDQQFVQGRYTSSYNFDYVMSVSIHDDTQQVIVALPQLKKTVLFAFSSTNLTLINQADHPARSTVWLDKNGTQVGLLLSNEAVLPWAQSRIEIFNITSKDISYVYPNNQQELMPWSTQLPSFLRLTATYDYQPVILTTDGTIILVPLTEAGYFMSTSDINAGRKIAIPCPAGTYKSIRGTTPCTICPPGTKSLSNEANQSIPTIICTACSTDSFCPLASVADIDASLFQSISQAYAYPSSPTTTSFDDILMQNTFSLSTQPVRCLMISPFFWALITLIIAFIILIVMGFLYYSPKGTKHFDRLKCFFRHSDLVGNGEAWFGGLVSFAIVVLIIYGFAFGSVFVTKYPIETSTDAEFACDTSLRNAQFSSLLQLLATIKSTEEEPIFKMLDTQKFTMNVTFIQTGYTCKNVATQVNENLIEYLKKSFSFSRKTSVLILLNIHFPAVLNQIIVHYLFDTI